MIYINRVTLKINGSGIKLGSIQCVRCGRMEAYLSGDYEVCFNITISVMPNLLSYKPRLRRKPVGLLCSVNTVYENLGTLNTPIHLYYACRYHHNNQTVRHHMGYRYMYITSI